MKIGDRVYVIDECSHNYLKSGKIIAEYDRKYYKAEFRVLIKDKDKEYKLGFTSDQILVIDGKLPFKSRHDFYRAIKSGKLSGQSLVDTLRSLRDQGFLEIKLPG